MYESATAVTDRGSTSWNAGFAKSFEPRPTQDGAGHWSQRTQSLLGVQIVGTGSYVPDNIVTNADLQERYGFDPAWIEQRTGILARRHAPPEQATSHLCIEAARRAL